MEPTGIIRVNHLKIYARHGVFPEETALGHQFDVCVSLIYPIDCRAYCEDDLEGTLNYALVVEEIEQVMAKPSRLLEYVAHRIMQRLKQRFPLIQGGEITIAKLNPPIPAVMESVSVTLRF